MKDANKSSIKKAKKNKNQELEKDLSEKLRYFFTSLGHDVEDIGEELKKTSKLLAKKLSKKFEKVKSVMGDKLQNANEKIDKNIDVAKKEISKDKALLKKAIKKISKDTSLIKKATHKISEEIKQDAQQKKGVANKSIKNVKKDILSGVDKITKVISPKKTISKTAVKPVVDKKPMVVAPKKVADKSVLTIKPKTTRGPKPKVSL